MSEQVEFANVESLTKVVFNIRSCKCNYVIQTQLSVLYVFCHLLCDLIASH